MGHADTNDNASGESAAEKVAILQDAGVMVAPTPSDMGTTVAALLKGK